MARRWKYNPRQPRDARGRWKKAGSASGTAAAPKRKSTSAKPARVSRIVGSVPGPVEGKSKYYTDRKGDFTADPSRPRPKTKAKRKKQGKANAVPYVRVSPTSVTGGVNAGSPLGKNTRIVVGGYVRVERTNRTKTELQLQQALQNASPLAKLGLAKVMTKEVKISDQAKARLGTSSTGLPSVTVSKSFSSVSTAKRVAAITDFNNAMARRTVGKKQRPQRRKKNPPGSR